MKLPNYDKAYIPIRKLRDYCLNPRHPVGRHKARVFKSVLGFEQADAQRLKRHILRALPQSDAIQSHEDEFGSRYVVNIQIPVNNEQEETCCYDMDGAQAAGKATPCYLLCKNLNYDMGKIKELDSVVLLKDLPAHHLKRGDVGTVVDILDDHVFEVEFTDEKGETTALLPLSETDVIRLNLNLTAV